MPDKITLSYVKKQIKAGYTHVVVCERKSIETSQALSVHKDYESARKALHKTKRANALWLLEDVRKELER